MGVLFPRIVLSLVLITASVSFAQAPADAPIAGPQEEAPSEPPTPQDELIPVRPRSMQEVPPNPILPRIFVEAFGGVLGGVGMGIVGLLAAASALEDTDCSGGDGCLAVMVVIAVPAAFVGIPLGVQTAGQSMGGRGDFIPALGGTLLGTGAGFIIGLRSESTGGLVASLIVGPILGAIVGYELSSSINERRGYIPAAAASSSPGLRVVPVAGVTPRGGLLGGLSGSF